ncbi:hypothetical protein [Curtobacterium sp. 24E2]|nr:hypothetical protein JN350_05275 [Curtobacterium sp. 24E2]
MGFDLLSADGSEQIGTWSVRGNETSQALAASFEQEYRDGQVLVVRHAEARTRLELWTDDVLQLADARTEQRFRIVDGRFIPLGSTPVVATPGDPVTLHRGADTPVEARLMLQDRVTTMSGEAVFTAPSGTVFAAGQEVLAAEIRIPGGQWERSRSLDMEVQASGSSNASLTGRFRSDALDLPGGTLIRWPPSVHVPDGAAAGTSGLEYRVTGTANGAAVSVTT